MASSQMFQPELNDILLLAGYCPNKYRDFVNYCKQNVYPHDLIHYGLDHHVWKLSLDPVYYHHFMQTPYDPMFNPMCRRVTFDEYPVMCRLDSKCLANIKEDPKYGYYRHRMRLHFAGKTILKLQRVHADYDMQVLKKSKTNQALIKRLKSIKSYINAQLKTYDDVMSDECDFAFGDKISGNIWIPYSEIFQLTFVHLKEVIRPQLDHQPPGQGPQFQM
jgi:hypothetical protein